MRRRVQLILLTGAWFFATGCHWDFVQLLAWSRMGVENVRMISLSAALEKTFDAQEMCGLCRLVSDAKRDVDERSPSTTVHEARAQLIFLRAATIVIAPLGEPFPVVSTKRVPASERGEPPVPPPRLVG